jgi:hypothetical protein
MLADHRGVFSEGFYRCPVRPPTFVFKGLGKVPMVEGYQGLDPCLQEPIHKAVIEP